MTPKTVETTIVPVTDSDFEWMISGEPRADCGLSLPPGGVDEIATLEHVRRIVQRLHSQSCRAAWMVVSDGEIVGLCSFKAPPSPEGEVEIGYGVAAARRGLGHASRAVAAMIAEAKCDPSVRVIVADTLVLNIASQRVLERNDFERVALRIDAQDNEVICWRKRL